MVLPLFVVMVNDTPASSAPGTAAKQYVPAAKLSPVAGTMAIESTGEDKEETLGMPSPLILRAAFPANDSLDRPLNTTFAMSLLPNV